MTILEKVKFLKKFGYKSIAQVGGLAKAKELFTALKEMQKNGGMLLCDKCARRKIAETAPEDIDAALKKSIDDGVYHVAPDGANCFLCSENAKYLIPMGAAMDGIKKVSRKDYPGGDLK